ncbi:hypothetical protein BGW36DRAFT_422621 [Talaromyces proteolyticus]|uniref:Uncharacterized protein n=1 Tax=Talaromyces proteolyticus TaxID=1131652 RepID=A0AAD4Q4I2_9EURO|nr:uncharacterized protein BGW36DRAFT_422621 [Talaromyces proteolyticus]KAH8703040.1 hypothetical protein BGW36DRAFT_422621 [Talaromyces proteolyticus]
MVFAGFMTPGPSPYVPVPEDGEVEKDSLLPRSPEQQHWFSHDKQASRTRLLLSHAATFLVAVLLTTIIVIICRPFTSKTTTEQRMKYLHCGNSTAEARAQGCVFDLLANMWVPELCWDKEGTEEFMRTAPWQAYDSQDGTRLLTLEEMSERVERDRPYWTPLREHVIHCALMWQRQHRGFLSGYSEQMDFDSLSYQHTVHCSTSLMHMAGIGDQPPDPLDKIATYTWVGFSDCKVEI